MPERPDGGFDLVDPPAPDYRTPLTDAEKAELRAAGATDAEIADLERSRRGSTPGSGSAGSRGS